MTARDSIRLVIGTTNPGKVREIVGILEGVPGRIATLADLWGPDGAHPLSCGHAAGAPIPEPEETEDTFGGNARLKALHYARILALPCVAEDSGLVIDALDGEPGVHSARWHGTHYPAKFARIYERLAALGLTTSPARFVCHVALAGPEGIVFEAEGRIEGEVAPEPRGTNGFGYDPIFYYPPFGCTLAEVDPARKAAVSHRGRAFSALREYLLARA